MNFQLYSLQERQEEAGGFKLLCINPAPFILGFIPRQFRQAKQQEWAGRALQGPNYRFKMGLVFQVKDNITWEMLQRFGVVQRALLKHFKWTRAYVI